jgi:hypothetical protein
MPFFWDTVQLGSQHGHWFYEQNFNSILLPESLDSGHIPVFGMYLAFIWKLFGKSLLVSHLAMLPFVWGLIWQGIRLIKRFVLEKWIFPALLIFFCDPTLLAQVTLISPDVPLIFFFLYGLNAVLAREKFSLVISVIGLSLVSLRGIPASLALILIDLHLHARNRNITRFIKGVLNTVPPYIPGLLIFALYQLYHYWQRGWIGFHSDSPWAPSFEVVDIKGMIYNLGLMGWRLLDFGRIILWIVAGALFLIHWKKIIKDKKSRLAVLIVIVTLACYTITIVGFGKLIAHRYLMPVYLTFSLVAIHFIFNFLPKNKIRYWATGIIVVALLSGNLWIYPTEVAQGWDSSLAYLPYQKLRKEMINYMDEEKIDIEGTGSVFPNLAPIEDIELNGDERLFKRKDFETNKYFFYSNIFNDMKDEEIQILEENWELIHDLRKNRIFVKLYKNRSSN